MFILFAPGKMPDRVLQAEIGGKLALGALAKEEFPEAFQLFAQIVGNDPLLLREAALRFGRPNWCCQINIDGEAYGIWSAEGGCFACLGTPHAPSLILSAAADDMLALLSGGDIRFDYAGPRREALALQFLLERFLDQFLPHRARPEPPASKLKIGLLGVEPCFHQRDALVSTVCSAPGPIPRPLVRQGSRACPGVHTIEFDTLEALLESDVDAALVLPAEQTPEAWQNMTHAFKRHNLKCMAADLPRFLPACNYMRKIVRAGLIGEARSLRVLARAAVPFAALEFILGCACAEITAADAGAAIARFENGALANITVDPFAEDSIEIYGTTGVILESHAWARPVRFYSSDPRMAEDLETWVEPYIEHTSPDWETLAAREALAALAKSVQEKKEPGLTPAQTARAVACAAAMRLSADENRAVTLDEMAPGHQIARRIQPLPRELWEGYEVPFRYKTSHYYDTELLECDYASGVSGMGVAFTKRAFEAPISKSFSDKLYQPYWDGGAQAYGILEDGELIACVEIWAEGWSNRLRVTQMWVAEEYRRQGYGRALMDFAKARAVEQGRRALIVETQSCNEHAIAFYQAQGLTLFGFDRSCYSNRDIENREVRLELGLYF